MNTTPDDEILALWVEDELHGPERAQVDAWAATQPEWLAHREDARRLKPLLRSVLPAAEEPPYADFFNARIAREIAVAEEQSAPQRGRSRNWLTWFMPTAAAAGMALCFWAGTHVTPAGGSAPAVAATPPAPHHPASAPAASLVALNEPFLYTPEFGVKANWYSSAEAAAPVIVLDGLTAIPDSFEVPETASVEKDPYTTADLDR